MIVKKVWNIRIWIGLFGALLLFHSGTFASKVTLDADGGGADYTSLDTGKEARDSVTFSWTWGIGVDKVVGVTYKLTQPGEGTLLINAGHLEWDADGNLVFIKGNYGKEDYDKFCAWFAE